MAKAEKVDDVEEYVIKNETEENAEEEAKAAVRELFKAKNPGPPTVIRIRGSKANCGA